MFIPCPSLRPFSQRGIVCPSGVSSHFFRVPRRDEVMLNPPKTHRHGGDHGAMPESFHELCLCTNLASL